MRPKPRTLVLLGIFVLGVLCAWGDRGAFLPFGASVLEPFSFFRRAHRYLYVAALPFAIVAAEGLAQLSRLGEPETRKLVLRVMLGACSVAIIIFGVAYFLHIEDPHKNNQVRQALGLGIVSTLVGLWITAMVLRSSGAAQRRFLWLCVLIAGVDLWFARAHVLDKNMHDVPRAVRDAEVLALQDVPLGNRIYDNAYLKFRPGIRLKIRDFGGYEDDPLALRRYAGFLNACKKSLRYLGHAAVAHIFEEGAKVHKKSSADLKALKTLRKGVFDVNEVAASVLWFDTATVVDGNHDVARKRLLAGKPGSAAILEAATLSDAQRARAQEGSANTAPVAGALMELTRNSLRATIDAPDDGIVVIHEAFFPRGWSAYVDGEKTEIVPANALFRGVFVKGGAHEIEMRYEATGYKWLVFLQLLALAAALALWLLRRRYDERLGFGVGASEADAEATESPAGSDA
jgi:hypothetical protein